MGPRNIVIAWVAFTGILFPGGLLFRDSEAILVAFQVVAFAVGFTVLHVLDGRDRRRRQPRS